MATSFPDYTSIIKAMQLGQIKPNSPVTDSPENVQVTLPTSHPLVQSLISPSSVDMTQNYQGPNASSLISPKIAAPSIQPSTIPTVPNINQQPFHEKQAALLAAAPNPNDPAFKHKWWANT